MIQSRLDVLSCVEHERLAFELLEVRTRGQYLTRLRGISREEQAEWDRRGRAPLAQIMDHAQEHARSRLKTFSGRRESRSGIVRLKVVKFCFAHVSAQAARACP